MTRRIFPKPQYVLVGLALLAPLTAGSAYAENSVGWVFANQPDATAPYTPDSSFNSANGTVTVKPAGGGAYYVYFTKLPNASDNVQISAYNTSGYCAALGFAGTPTGLTVIVQCYDEHYKPANSAFTLLGQSRNAPFGGASKGVAFLWDNDPTNTGSYAPPAAGAFNSTGGTNTVQRNKIGNYTATLPGLTKLGGNIQVTADGYPPHTARCKAVTWGSRASSTTVTIQCYNRAGAADDSEFLLGYAVGEPFGVTPGVNPRAAWAWATDLTSTSVYTPNLNYQYNGFGTGRLTAQKTGTGQYTVTIPGTLSYSTSIALVSATGTGNGYCNIVSWTTSAIHVACYRQGGIPADSRFEVSLETAN